MQSATIARAWFLVGIGSFTWTDLAAATAGRPANVIVIVADDVGVDMVGAYAAFYANHPAPGYANVTPILDRLAQTGMLFRNAWANPYCSPTRAQILTGRPGLRSGIGKVVDAKPPSLGGIGLQYGIDLLPTVLRRATTPLHSAAVGKWHLADFTQSAAGLPAHALGTAPRWFDQWAGSLANLNNQNYNAWDKTFAAAIIPGVDECVPSPGSFCTAPVTQYATVDTADDAIHLIQTLHEPFFLYVAFNAAHAPLDGPAVTPTPASCLGGAWTGFTNPPYTGVDKAIDTRCLVTWLDNELGRILCAVDDSPLRPELDTSVMFLGDNGTAHSAIVAPFDPAHSKGTVYEGGVHVPMIVRSPILRPALMGSVCDALVCATDVFATVAELAGAPLPDDPYRLRDSVSFVPHLLGEPGSRRSFAYAEVFSKNFVPGPDGSPPPEYLAVQHLRAIRDVAGVKLIQNVKYAPGTVEGFIALEQLYDLAADPHEQVDLMAGGVSPGYVAAYAQLKAVLDLTYPHLVP